LIRQEIVRILVLYAARVRLPPSVTPKRGNKIGFMLKGLSFFGEDGAVVGPPKK
jgi:hypothetical protein